ncbi:MAG TPA: SRPBCC domain-containing protein [Caulobacteraceae bacterium]|nr:SRPBCC domain-containing protein [Caulobacteraceae bacterium]
MTDGRWTIVDRRDGVDYRALGEYLEVEPPRRLVFTFGMPQFSAGLSKVSVDIAADGGGSVMTLVQEDLPPEAIAALEEGWRAMFDAFALAVAA